jgi:hypothetical protein
MILPSTPGSSMWPPSLRLPLQNSLSLTHTYTHKNKALYILIFTFLDSKLQDRNSAPNDSQHSLTSACSEFLHDRNFDTFWLFQNI